MSDSNVNKVIEEFSHLPVEDKEYVAGIITKQVVDVKREMLAERVREAKENFQKGFVRTGTIRELMEDLDRD
jgi:hypothetical protein